ncbi:RrF2 family transcriptional regulator [Acidaminobacterium chupaoyuni]
MKITREADYAVRVVYTIMCCGDKISAREIAEGSGVTVRFALKILHKLTGAGIIQSYKGVNGGFTLLQTPEEISIGQIIECIDGPFEISHCLSENAECTRMKDKTMCQFRKIFDKVSHDLRDELYAIKMTQFQIKKNEMNQQEEM